VFGVPWWLIGYGVVALVLVFAFVRIGQGISRTLERANKYDETQRKLDAVEAAYTTAVDRFTKAAADDAHTNGVLTAFGSRLDASAAEIVAAVKASKVIREVSHVDEKSGATVSCRERDPAIYRLHFNAAVDGIPADTASSVVP
jgi:predicted NBD/HSP70 family sugar kinase